MRFAIGDKVYWKPSDTWHAGTVVGVVPDEHSLAHVEMGEPYCRMRLPDGWTRRRDHESYIVFDEQTRRLYWPRVSGLRSCA